MRVDDLRYNYTKGHLSTNGTSKAMSVGFHLYYENCVIQNLVHLLMLKTNIRKKKPILMLSVDENTYKTVGRCQVWTAYADNLMYRIVKVDGAYDIFRVDGKTVVHKGTAERAYFPRPANAVFEENIPTIIVAVENVHLNVVNVPEVKVEVPEVKVEIPEVIDEFKLDDDVQVDEFKLDDI